MSVRTGYRREHDKIKSRHKALSFPVHHFSVGQSDRKCPFLHGLRVKIQSINRTAHAALQDLCADAAKIAFAFVKTG